MNKPLLITGASSDIGVELIKKLALPGQKIIAHYCKSLESLKAVQAEVAGEIIPLKADFSIPQETEAFLNELRRFPAPSKVVHLSAPAIEYRPFADTEWKEFEENFQIQVRSIQTILRQVIPEMVQNKFGRVVFALSSVVHEPPTPLLSPYTVAKSALLGLMRTLTAEYNSRGLTFNAVSPSMTQTQFLSKIDPRVVENIRSKHPLKRLALPCDFVPLIEFLLKEESSYTNGQTFCVSGGTAY